MSKGSGRRVEDINKIYANWDRIFSNKEPEPVQPKPRFTNLNEFSKFCDESGIDAKLKDTLVRGLSYLEHKVQNAE